MPILASNFAANSLQGTVTVTGGQANIVLPLATFAFEGQKTFVVDLRKEGYTGTVMATSNTITIPDTNSNIISFTSNISTMNETSSNVVLFTITTANVPNGANIYYTTNSIVNANVNTSDFVGGNTGVITIINNSATFTLRANLDINTEGTETYNIFLRTGNTAGNVFYTANANTITILDTSTPPITTGSLYVWGYNGQGGLGVGDTTNRNTPVQVSGGGSTWKYVSGGYTTAATKSDGTLWVWGNNAYGQVTASGVGTTIQTPTQIPGTSWLTPSTGRDITACIRGDGTLWIWGKGVYGQLGNNGYTNRSSPVQTIAGGTNWSSISAGRVTMGAIKTDGTLWMWGNNSYGSLGDGTRTTVSSPIQTIAAGSNWSQVCVDRINSSSQGNAVGAVKTDGTLWVWGGNQYGQLGTNNTTKYSSPVQTIAGGTNWRQIDCSSGQHFHAIKTDGTLWSWGRNSYGQLGLNDTTNRSSPVQITGGGTTWQEAVATYNGGVAVKTDGTLWSWGKATTFLGSANLGDGTTTSRSSPVQIGANKGTWLKVSAGGYNATGIAY